MVVENTPWCISFNAVNISWSVGMLTPESDIVRASVEVAICPPIYGRRAAPAPPWWNMVNYGGSYSARVEDWPASVISTVNVHEVATPAELTPAMETSTESPSSRAAPPSTET